MLHQCKVCKECFANYWDLKRHSHSHPKKTCHACELCPKMFKSEFGLLQHRLAHEKEKAKSTDILRRVLQGGFSKPGTSAENFTNEPVAGTSGIHLSHEPPTHGELLKNEVDNVEVDKSTDNVTSDTIIAPATHPVSVEGGLITEGHRPCIIRLFQNTPDEPIPLDLRLHNLPNE